MSVDARLGSEIAGYRIERLLGRGGMGAVYLAEDTQLGRGVALKLLAAELAHDERFRERFLRESRMAASLDHPAIVPIYQAGEAEGQLFIAMRYVEGTDLRKLLAEGPLEPGRALSILVQVATALDVAHQRGLVHRDVKPGNILLDDHGNAYLSDFGLTKQASSQSGLTMTGQLVGTVDYVAPEQIKGGEVGPAADVYSLGCVLYECLSGRRPFERENEVAVIWAHVNEAPAHLPDLPAVDVVLAKALAKSPSDRHPTARALVEDARRALGLSSGELARPALPVRPRLRLLLISAALLLVALVAGLVLATRGGDDGISSLSPNSLGVIDPASNRLVGEIPIGGRAAAPVVTSDAVWVPDFDDQTLVEVDPASRKVARTIGLGFAPRGIAVTPDLVWVTDPQHGLVVKVDPRTGTIVSSVRVRMVEPGFPEALPSALALGAGSVWANSGLARLARIPSSGDTIRSIPGNYEVTSLAFGGGALWYSDRNSAVVVKVDANTNAVSATIAIGSAAAAAKAPVLGPLAVGATSVWVVGVPPQIGGVNASAVSPDFSKPATVYRIDPSIGGVTASIGIGREDSSPGALQGYVDILSPIAASQEAVWVANSADKTISRIDPRTNRVVKTIELGRTPLGIAVGEGAVWVTVGR